LYPEKFEIDTDDDDDINFLKVEVLGRSDSESNDGMMYKVNYGFAESDFPLD